MALVKDSVVRLRPVRRRPSTSRRACTNPSNCEAEGWAAGDLARSRLRYSATTGMVVLRSDGMICARMMPRALSFSSRLITSRLATEKP
ncbi:hypothetical protein D3C71_1700200 [compost metagenome]